MTAAVETHPAPLLDREAVARRLGVTTRTVDNLRKRGRLKFVKFGNNVRFRGEDLEHFLASSSIEIEPGP